MSAPGQVLIKRKRTEAAPDTLVVEQQPQSKRALTGSLHYVRKVEELKEAFSQEDVDRKQSDLTQDGRLTSRPASRDGKRVFHLARPREGGVVKRKGKNARAKGVLATFEEQRTGTAPTASARSAEPVGADVKLPMADAPVLKRPGRGAAVSGDRTASSQLKLPESIEQRQRVQAVADQLQTFALEEVERPMVTMKPRFATRRRQPERTEAAIPEPANLGEAMKDEGDADYVYDTYILASDDSMVTPGQQPVPLFGEIGYLVIADEDQSLWEEYIEDEDADKEFETDDEDENAEDYYGADYPEDELASDDEYDRGAYGYRHSRGSDDEEYDEDTGAYSDEDEDQEWRKTMDPWARRK